MKLLIFLVILSIFLIPNLAFLSHHIIRNQVQTHVSVFSKFHPLFSLNRNKVIKLYALNNDNDDNFSDDDEEVEVEVEEEELIGEVVENNNNNDNDEGEEGEEVEENGEENEVEEEPTDPELIALIEQEKEVKAAFKKLEDELRSERFALRKTKDKLSESGKTGFFIIQAQVNEFLKRKESEQSKRVSNYRRQFVEKMLPIIDLFRNAPLKYPPTTEKEKNMHESFSSLLDSIIIVAEKYGYKEFTPEIGSTLNPKEHEVVEMVVDEVGDKVGTVVEVRRNGVKEREEDIFRRAQVVGAKEPNSNVEEEIEEIEEEGEEGEEGEETETEEDEDVTEEDE